MKCVKCEEELEGIYCFDTGGGDYLGKDIAYNLYACNNCGTLLKEDVWENKGIISINIDNIQEKHEGLS